VSYVDRIRSIQVDFLKAREEAVRKDSPKRKRKGSTSLLPLGPLSPIMKTNMLKPPGKLPKSQEKKKSILVRE